MEIKVKNGIVKLKLPNFTESWRLRSIIGTAPDDVDAGTWSIIKLSEVLPAYLDVSKVKKCKTPSDFINNGENSADVIIAIGKLAERIMEFSGEKK